jgi:hypothetical protein
LPATWRPRGLHKTWRGDWLQDHHPCTPEVANRHTGYLVGGTSPFGTRKPIPIYLQESITALPRIYINGGNADFWSASLSTIWYDVLKPTLVDAAA